MCPEGSCIKGGAQRWELNQGINQLMDSRLEQTVAGVGNVENGSLRMRPGQIYCFQSLPAPMRGGALLLHLLQPRGSVTPED